MPTARLPPGLYERLLNLALERGHKFTVNGTVMQGSNTRRMTHNLYELIEYESNILTLSPGDIISGGSPAGAEHRAR